MRVQIGPVPSGSVDMWVAYARTVLAQSMARPNEHGVRLTMEAVEGFERFLDQWEVLAEEDAEFTWTAEVDPEEIEYLVHVWFTLAEHLADEADQRGFPLSPPEGDAFYQALILAVLNAFSYEGRSMLEFAEQLRDRWPGLKQN